MPLGEKNKREVHIANEVYFVDRINLDWHRLEVEQYQITYSYFIPMIHLLKLNRTFAYYVGKLVTYMHIAVLSRSILLAAMVGNENR